MGKLELHVVWSKFRPVALLDAHIELPIPTTAFQRQESRAVGLLFSVDAIFHSLHEMFSCGHSD